METSTASYVEPYEPSSGVGRFTGTRIGDSTDILVLYYGSEEEITEYVQGFLFLGYFFLVVYLIWGIALCIPMCCGRKRAGFWSGRPFRKRHFPDNQHRIAAGGSGSVYPEGTDRMEEDDHYEQQMAQDHGKQQQSNANSQDAGISLCTPAEPLCSCPNITRIAFIVLALLVIILSILFATKGLQAIQEETVDVYHENTLRVQDLTKDGRALINQGSNAVTSSANLIRTALRRESRADNFCPGDPSLRNSAAARDAFEQITDAQQVIDYLEEYNQDNMAEINRVLDDFQSDLGQAEEELDGVDVNAGAVVMVILYLILMVAFIAATILAILGKDVCILTKGLQWVGMPILIILTVISLTWIVVVPIVGGMNSDLCQPHGSGSSPDDLIFDVLQREGYSAGNDRFDAVEYLIKYQCQDGKDPYRYFHTYLRELDTHQDSISEILVAIRDNDAIAQYCDRDFVELNRELEDLNRLIDLLRATARDFMELISCENLVPIYTSSVYDATCNNSTKAIMWLYMTSFFLTFFGFLMITLRAAYRVSREDEEVPEAEYDLKLASNVPEAHNPSTQYGQAVVAAEVVPPPTEHSHMAYPIGISPSVSALSVPSHARQHKTGTANDDGFDC